MLWVGGPICQPKSFVSDEFGIQDVSVKLWSMTWISPFPLPFQKCDTLQLPSPSAPPPPPLFPFLIFFSTFSLPPHLTPPSSSDSGAYLPTQAAVLEGSPRAGVLLLPAVWCWAGADEPQPPPRVHSPSSNIPAGCRAKAVALIKRGASTDPLVHSKWEKKTNYRSNLQNHSAASNIDTNSCLLPFRLGVCLCADAGGERLREKK